MNYVVVSRGDELSNRLAEQFRQMATRRNLTEDPEQPEVVVSIGGDGTMLHAFHSFSGRWDRISFVGVHTGHLGFFADWKSAELEELVVLMAERKLEEERLIVQYPIVEMELMIGGGTKTMHALNEFTLKGDGAMLFAQLNINDKLFEMFRGDGICVSSPSGSTAYNKSLGGAVIHPSLESIQIAEIASINNRVYRSLGSSVVLPRHHHCDIIPRPGQRLVLTCDHVRREIHQLERIRCFVSNQKVRFARYRPFPFWNRVREAFIHNDAE